MEMCPSQSRSLQDSFFGPLLAQELSSVGASTVACIVTSQLVMCPDQYKDKLKAARGVSAFMSKEVGLTKEDLPELLKHKFQKFAETKEAPQEELHDCKSWFNFVVRVCNV